MTNQINQITTFYTFCPSFSTLSVFLQLDLLAPASTSKVLMVHTSSPSRRCLAKGEAHHRSLTTPLIAAVLDKIGVFGS
jgi:hypothetical protein